jgi:hypothetical protein
MIWKSYSAAFFKGDEFEYFYFVTNTEMASEKMVIAYEKRGNAENYIKEAKYNGSPYN